MNGIYCIVTLVCLIPFNCGLEERRELLNNKSLSTNHGNGTIEESGTKINTSRFRPAVIMLSVEFVKEGNLTNATGHKHQDSEILLIDGDKTDDMSFFERPKASPYFPRFSDISMRSLYLIVCMCLVVLLLIIIKLVLSRRNKNKDYALVTKGEFDA